LGVTPSAWVSPALNVLEFPNGANLFSSSAAMFQMGSNSSYLATTGYTYKATGFANRFRLDPTGAFQWYTAPSGTVGTAISFTQAMTLDAGGRLLVGLTSSLGSNGIAQIGGNSDTRLIIDGSSTQGIFFTKSGADNGTYRVDGSGNFQWFIKGAGSPNMTLDPSGNLLVGTTSATYKSQFSLPTTTGNGNPALFLSNADTTNPRGLFYFASGTASGDYAFLYQGAGTNRFYVNGAGNVYGTGAYNAISDASLKTNIRSLELGLSEILALQPRRFDWIDGSKENAIGFIAQEVEAVTSDLIVGWSRSVESIETLKAVSVTDIIPILVKSIQEQQALITQLTARITALEGA
jgi:hypothetical protein